MITFNTKEEFQLAVEEVIRNSLSISVSSYSPDYYDIDSNGVEVELYLNRDIISSDSASI